MFEFFFNGDYVFGGGDVVFMVSFVVGKGKIFSYDVINVDGVNVGFFESFGKGNDFGGVVEFVMLDEIVGLGKDGGDGVGGGFMVFLVFMVVVGDGVVGSFRFEGFVIGGDENGGYEIEGVEVLSDNVGLDVIIVV